MPKDHPNFFYECMLIMFINENNKLLQNVTSLPGLGGGNSITTNIHCLLYYSLRLVKTNSVFSSAWPISTTINHSHSLEVYALHKTTSP